MPLLSPRLARNPGVTRFIKPSVAGYLMQKELEYLGRALANPKRPFVAVLGMPLDLTPRASV